MTMRIYVVGPVSGHDDLNAPAFEEARKNLRDAGFEPMIPHDFIMPDANWQQAMRRSLETLAKADGVATLGDIAYSYGASIEVLNARALGIPVMPVLYWCMARPGMRGNALKETKECPMCKRVLPTATFFKEGEDWCRDCSLERIPMEVICSVVR